MFEEYNKLSSEYMSLKYRKLKLNAIDLGNNTLVPNIQSVGNVISSLVSTVASLEHTLTLQAAIIDTLLNKLSKEEVEQSEKSAVETINFKLNQIKDKSKLITTPSGIIV